MDKMLKAVGYFCIGFASYFTFTEYTKHGIHDINEVQHLLFLIGIPSIFVITGLLLIYLGKLIRETYKKDAKN